METEKAFDLSQVSGESWRLGKGKHFAFYLIAAIFAGGAVWFLFDALAPPRNAADWTLLGITESISGAMLIVLAVVISKTGRPPILIRVGALGLELRWASGRADFWNWKHLPRGFVLLDYSVNPMVAQNLPMFQWELRRLTGIPTPLTKEAFDAIVQSAESAGLATQTELLRNPTWGWARCRATRFKPRSASTV